MNVISVSSFSLPSCNRPRESYQLLFAESDGRRTEGDNNTDRALEVMGYCRPPNGTLFVTSSRALTKGLFRAHFLLLASSLLL